MALSLVQHRHRAGVATLLPSGRTETIHPGLGASTPGGAGLGTLFGALHQGAKSSMWHERRIEKKLTVVPLFTRDKKGVLVIGAYRHD
jgi:hypothetical protein